MASAQQQQMAMARSGARGPVEQGIHSPRKNPNSDEQLISQFEELQHSEADLSKPRKIHFFYILEKVDANGRELEIIFKSPKLEDPVSMKKISDYVYYGHAEIPANTKELKYTYQSQILTKQLTKEVVQVDRSKSAKFTKLNTIFDFMDVKLAMNLKLSTSLDNLVETLMIQLQYEGFYFSGPTIFNELVKFLAAENSELRYSSLIKHLKEQIRIKKDTHYSQYAIYTLRILGYLNVNKLEKKSDKRVLPILKDFRAILSFGHFHNYFMQETDQQIKQELKQGIYNIAQIHPLISIEFFDMTFLESRQQDILNSLEKICQDQKYHNYLIQSLKVCHDYIKMSKQSMDRLFKQGLQICKDLVHLLTVVESLKGYLDYNSDALIDSTRVIYTRVEHNKSGSINQFLQSNFSRVIKIKGFVEVLKPQLNGVIQQQLQNPQMNSQQQEDVKNIIMILEQHPYLISLEELENYLLLQKNQLLQQSIINLVLCYLKYKQLTFNSTDLKSILLTVQKIFRVNFKNLLIYQQSFEQIATLLLSFQEHLQNSFYYTVFPDGYSHSSLVEQLISIIGKQSSSYKSHETIKSLYRMYDSKKQLNLMDLAVRCCKIIIENNGVDERISKDIIQEFSMENGPSGSSLKIADGIFMPLFDLVLQKAIDKQLDPPGLFDDELLYYIIRIELETNQLIPRLRDKVKIFISKINSEDITLSEISANIINKKPYFEKMIKFIDPQFNFQLKGEKLVQEFNKFNEEKDKHTNFLQWALQFGSAVQLTTYKQEIELIKNLDKITYKEAKALQQNEIEGIMKNSNQRVQTRWDLKNKNFKTLKLFFNFRHSNIFTKLYKKMNKEYVVQIQKHRQLQGAAQAQPQNDLSLKEFDQLCKDLLFDKITAEFTQNLYEYPQNTQIFNQQYLEEYWEGIPQEQVDKELNMFYQFQKIHFDFPRVVQPQLKIDLIQSSKVSELIEKAKTIEALQDYQKDVSGLNNEEKFKVFEDFVKFYRDIQESQQSNLQEIAREVSKVESVFNEIQGNLGLNWDILRILKDSKDLFVFCNTCQEDNFDNFIESLDNESSLTSETLSTMNFIAKFFREMHLGIQNIDRSKSFKDLLLYMIEKLTEHLKIDSLFLEKIQICNANLPALKEIVERSINKSENTIKIIQSCVKTGLITWFKVEAIKYDFKIEYTVEDVVQGQIKEDKRSQNSEQLIQHSSRAHLLIHSRKTDHNQKDVIESNVEKFTKIIEFCVKICRTIDILQLYGHGMKSYNICEEVKILEDVIQKLEQKYTSNSKILRDWQAELLSIRKQYYFLTYLPNDIIYDLLELQKTGQTQLSQKHLKKLIELKLLSESSELHAVNDIPEPNIFIKLNRICMDHMMMELQERKAKIETIYNNDTRKLVQHHPPTSRAIFKYLSEEVGLAKAIINVFTSFKIVPSVKDIMFCNEQTSITNIQAFIMRALLYENQMKEHLKNSSKQVINRPFVLANFQRLPINIQTEAYNFIKKEIGEDTKKDQQKKQMDSTFIETSEAANTQNKNFYLYVLSVAKDIKNATLIEEVKIQTQNFGQLMKEEELKKILEHYQVQVYYSESSGLGKSTLIRNAIQKNLEYKLYKRMPIYGELARDKIIQRHRDKLFEQLPNGDQVKRKDGISIHYDVYPTENDVRDLNIIMFEILILGSICDNNGNPFYLPEKMKFYIELSNSLNEKIYFTIFQSFRIDFIKWNCQNIYIDEKVDNKFRRVCKYLKMLDMSEKKIKDYHFPSESDPKMKDDECIFILNQKIVAGKLRTPNYYYVNSFVDFMNDQLIRLEKSTYFQPENLIDQMTSGLFDKSKKDKAKILHRDIVKNLYELALRISIVEKFQDNPLAHSQTINLARRSETLQQAMRIQDNQWDVYSYPFIVFNDDGQITPLYTSVDKIPEPLREFQKKRQKLEYKEYEKMEQNEIVEQILEMCVDESRKRVLRGQVDLNNIVFTLDNVMKLILIYLRIRANMPVLLMGETGVGKTSLIEYLGKIIDAECLTLNVHAGITEDEIINHVLLAQEKAKRIQPSGPYNRRKKVIIFFDEINTNKNISGLLKEIFTDKCILGEPLEDNISIVSACNPLKQRKTELSYLTEGLNPRGKDDTKSNLVYKVEPLPESLIPYIWDFNSLSEVDEKKYIQKMINKTFETSSLQGRNISLVNLWVLRDHKQKELDKIQQLQRDQESFAEAIQKLQNYIKQKEDSPWAVSLRDVSRFCKLLVYFNDHATQADQSVIHHNKRKSQVLRRLDVAFALSIYFCYLIKMNTNEKRLNMINQFKDIYHSYNTVNSLMKDTFNEIIRKEQEKILDLMDIPPGIGKNLPLRENVFVIIHCILNQIPLIITGKPGSSKTLAMNLVLKSFKGAISSKAFFQHYPKFQNFYFQGSEQSTSKAIERIYKRAHDLQEKLDRKQTIVVVTFDEIGLAEYAPTNPLKVMHSLLEPPRVATVGLSNYVLDASKMNRVINLQRTEPGDEDLIESARSIAVNSSDIFKERYLKQLVQWYSTYKQIQSNDENLRHFHGLRDFYSMIKYISPRIKHHDHVENEKAIIQGIKRNFGGANYVETVASTIQNIIEIKEIGQLRALQPDEMIKQNIQESNPEKDDDGMKRFREMFESRHQMIITDNQDSALQFIQDNNKQPKIFFGSDFPDDLNEDATYKLINQIIMQMENSAGSLCVFLGLNEIQQYFFDMLNQNYQIVGTQRFCKVAIGADSSRCLVNKYFRCVLIVDSQQAYKLDAPLLNRFEKQKYTDEQRLDVVLHTLVIKLENWATSLQIQNFTRKQMFPTLTYVEKEPVQQEKQTQSIIQIVILCKQLYIKEKENGVKKTQQELQDDVDKVEKEAKRCMISVATLSGILRMKTSSASDKDFWYNEYMKDEKHFNLASLVDYCQKNWREDPIYNLDHGYNLIVYTHSAILAEVQDSLPNHQIKMIKLSDIGKKDDFENDVLSFFKDKKENMLIVYADILNDSKNRINMCRSIINNSRMEVFEKQAKDNQPQMHKHVIFIIRIDHMKDGTGVSFGRGWRQYTLDILNGSGNTAISIKSILNNEMNTLIIDSITQEQFFIQAIVESLSKIQYYRSSQFIKERIQIVWTLFQDPQNSEFLKDLVEYKLKQGIKQDSNQQSWTVAVARSEFLMKSHITLHGAALNHIKKILVQYLSFIIFHLEQDGVIFAKDNPDLFEKSKKLFTNHFQAQYAQNKFQDMYYLLENFDKIKFPLASLIHQEFNKLKTQYINILKEQNQQLNSQFSKKFNENIGEFVKMTAEQKKEFIENDKYQKLLIEDKELDKNIKNVKEWFHIYCPESEFAEILEIYNEIYLKDFSYLLLQQILSNDRDFRTNPNQNEQLHVAFQTFIYESFMMLMKQNLQSKAHIYAIYWKCDNILSMVFRVIQYNFDKKLEFFNFDSFIQRLKEVVQAHKIYKDHSLTYLPREVFLQSVVTVFYEIYYPSQINRKNWSKCVQHTFSQLNKIISLQINGFKSKESRVMIFLLNFWNEILSDPDFGDSKQDIFISFASDIKDVFNQPQKVVESIIVRRETLFKELKTVEKQQKLYAKTLRFIFDYSIESFELKERMPTSYFLNSLITLLRVTNDYIPKQLQYSNDFKNSLPKLIQIALSQISGFQMLKIIDNQRKYDELVQQDEEIRVLNGFFNINSELQFSDPIIIAINDHIEKQFEVEKPDKLNKDKISEKLIESKRIILTEQQNRLQQIVAIAYFKRVSKLFVDETLKMIKTNDYSEKNPVFKKQMEEFFNEKDQTNKDTLYPLCIYQVKLLFGKRDILNKYFPFFIQRHPWITQYEGALSSQIKTTCGFAYMKDPLFQQATQQFQQQSAKMEDFLRETSTDPLRKFAGIVVSIQETYLNREQAIPDQNLLRYLTAKKEERAALEVSIAYDKYIDPHLKMFLKPIYSGRSVKAEGKDKVLDLFHNEKPYFSSLMLYLGAACHSGDTFFSQFVRDPSKIKDFFIPFVQDFKVHDGYQSKIQQTKDIVKLQCSACKSITLAIQLPSSKKRGKKQVTEYEKSNLIGVKTCIKCKDDNLGVKQNMLLDEKVDFSAERSYIPLNIEDKQQYRELRVRDFSVQELSIGRILIHSLLMLISIFSDSETDYQIMKLVGVYVRQKDYIILLKETIHYLKTCLMYDWNTLKKHLCINDDKVSQVIQQVILGIVKEHSRYHIDYLKTDEQRKIMENSFKEIINKVLRDKDSFFFENINPAKKIEYNLMELRAYQDNPFPVLPQDSYENLLRMKIKVTLKQFELQLKDYQMKGQDFFKMLFEQRHVVQSIKLIKPLINWANFISKECYAKITIEEAKELTIKNIIDRHSGNYDNHQSIIKQFKKFQEAWNSFTGLIIKEDNIDVVIPHISEQSPLIYCCMSQTTKDHEGYSFFLLVKYLSLIQNNLIKEAETMMKTEIDLKPQKVQKKQVQSKEFESDIFPSTSILELRKDQLIYFREKEGKNKQGNNEKEKLEEIILKNSTCRFEYGQGKQIEYNFTNIKKQVFELLLQGKYQIKIDGDTKVHFQFVNVGNLIHNFKKLHEKIPQYKVKEQVIQQLLKDKKPEFFVKLIELLRITLNFLLIQNNQDDKQSTLKLTKFIQALKISTEGIEINDIDAFKIENFIHLYEVVEEKVLFTEIESTNKRYIDSLTDTQPEQYKQKIQNYIQKKKQQAIDQSIQEKYYLELGELSNIVGRLCVRSLRNYDSAIAQLPIMLHLRSHRILEISTKFSDEFSEKTANLAKRNTKKFDMLKSKNTFTQSDSVANMSILQSKEQSSKQEGEDSSLRESEYGGQQIPIGKYYSVNKLFDEFNEIQVPVALSKDLFYYISEELDLRVKDQRSKEEEEKKKQQEAIILGQLTNIDNLEADIKKEKEEDIPDEQGEDEEEDNDQEEDEQEKEDALQQYKQMMAGYE